MNVIELPHKVLDYSCPVNGLEDQYEWKTGTRLPGYCLMDLASIGFTYIKQKNTPSPRMVFWGSGMGKPLFTFLAEIIGYDLVCSEDTSFRTAWKTARESLSGGTPVMLGILDMYHLHYYTKFYHRFHIPQHYVLLVGYDEQKDAALVQDNGLPGIQTVPLAGLQAAWNVRVPGQGKPNTLFTFKFHDTLADLETIWRKGLKKRANLFLSPPVGFMGLSGMRRVQTEMGHWHDELGDPAWMESLRSLATFTCSKVPNPPQALLRYPLGYEDPHQACRDRFAMELADAARTCNMDNWIQAADLFKHSGEHIGRLTDLTVSALKGQKEAFAGAAEEMRQVAGFEETAFKLLAQ